MAYSDTLTAFAQSVYLAIKNRYFDDIASADGQTYISEVIDWANQYFDELENITDANGIPVNWGFMRTNSFNLGTATTGLSQITISSSVLNIIAKPKRPLTITVAGIPVSTWSLVDADQLDMNSTNKYVARLGNVLYFNQPFVAAENGGTITADVTMALTRIDAADDDDSALTLVKPRQLLVMGVAKNNSLPDIVQGGLSPSFTQKYNDLLTSAIAFNSITSISDNEDRDDFSFITGIGF